MNESFPEFFFDHPKVGGLTTKERSVGEFWEEIWIVAWKIRVNIFVGMQFEELATDFNGEDLRIGELRGKATAS